MAKNRRDIDGSSEVYVATFWWDDSAPIGQVIAADSRTAERLINKMIKSEAKMAVEDDAYDTIDGAINDIRWSGVQPFRLMDVVSNEEYGEAILELNTNGYFYPEMP